MSERRWLAREGTDAFFCLDFQGKTGHSEVFYGFGSHRHSDGIFVRGTRSRSKNTEAQA